MWIRLASLVPSIGIFHDSLLCASELRKKAVTVSISVNATPIDLGLRSINQECCDCNLIMLSADY